jgi:hypothetical protein
MTANQELYAKALEIAVLILGRQGLEASMSDADFNNKIFFHNKLAMQLVHHIIAATPTKLS